MTEKTSWIIVDEREANGSIELNWHNTPPDGVEHLEKFTEWPWSLVPEEWNRSENEEDFWNILSPSSVKQSGVITRGTCHAHLDRLPARRSVTGHDSYPEHAFDKGFSHKSAAPNLID
jgi:hypothetical protein